jgi:hypothetical protein
MATSGAGGTSASGTTAATTTTGNGGTSGDSTSAVATTSSASGGPIQPASAARYPDNAIQSPLPKVAADRLRALAAIGMQKGLSPNIATKAGDGNSDHDWFLGCFSATHTPPFGNHPELDAAREHFKASFGQYADNSVYPPKNLCLATDDSDGSAGGTLDWIIGGATPLYAQEITRTKALFMPELFGMLDMGGNRQNGTADDVREERWRKIHQNLVAFTDGVIAEGAIPMLTSNLGYPTPSPVMYATETMNQIIRAVAQSRQVPFIDFYLAAWPAPDHGTASGGVHFSLWKGSLDQNDTCTLTDDALTAGMNVHNFVALQALSRMKEVIVDGKDSLDADQPALTGSGTTADPVAIPELPFSSAGDVTKAPSNAFADWSACGGGNETGGEYVYQFTTDKPIAVRALVLGDKGHDGCNSPTCDNVKDYGLHILKGGTTADHCIKTNNTMLEGTLSAGTYAFVVDNYAGVPKSNDFVFSLMACHDGDTACATPL